MASMAVTDDRYQAAVLPLFFFFFRNRVFLIIKIIVCDGFTVNAAYFFWTYSIYSALSEETRKSRISFYFVCELTMSSE